MKNSIAILIFSVGFLSNSYSQEDTTMMHLDLREFVANKNFYNKYQREYNRIKKVYPMALKAKALLDQCEQELPAIEKKRLQKKYLKDMHTFLKDEFTYSIKNLYRSEGQLLMELVHRETKMTVHEIIKKYSGNISALTYQGMGKMFDQDLKVKYDPNGKNSITEMVIQDILSGSTPFNPVMDPLTKDEFKQSQAEYRANKRKSNQQGREIRKEARETKRVERKSERDTKKNKK